MGAYKHIPGHKIEMLDFPFLDKNIKLFTFIKNEDLNPEVHDKIIDYLAEEVKEISYDKWYESEKAGYDIYWHGGFLHWLEKYETEFEESKVKNGCKYHPKEFEYSFLVKENGFTIWIVKKELKRKAEDYVQLGDVAEEEEENAKTAGKSLMNVLYYDNEDCLKWIGNNASKVRNLLEKEEPEGALIHGFEDWQKYVAWRNLEERIEEIRKKNGFHATLV